MAVGCVVGRERLEDIEQYQKAMIPAARVYDLFREKIGHTLCWEIHKIRYGKVYRLFVPEERQAFHERRKRAVNQIRMIRRGLYDRFFAGAPPERSLSTS